MTAYQFSDSIVETCFGFFFAWFLLHGIFVIRRTGKNSVIEYGALDKGIKIRYKA